LLAVVVTGVEVGNDMYCVERRGKIEGNYKEIEVPVAQSV
jgi:hypothetical protein